jgi:hypothetical protein
VEQARAAAAAKATAEATAAEAEAARLEELEYQADDPDSDLANAADVDIYETYAPQKLKIGRPHPDAVVEAACLSTVPLGVGRVVALHDRAPS